MKRLLVTITIMLALAGCGISAGTVDMQGMTGAGRKPTATRGPTATFAPTPVTCLLRTPTMLTCPTSTPLP
jgi:hypothetical protein